MINLSATKIKAIILGHAVGDALGVPVEFASREELDKEPITTMKGFGTYPYPAGSWSDDTSMTLCALESLAKGKLDFDDVMVNFGKWYYKDEFTPTGEMFDVGNTCSFAIDNYFAKHMDVKHCGLLDEQSNGNGSLMRCIPFALYGYYHPNMQRYIDEVGSALTHAHLRSQIACHIYSLILTKLIDNPSKDMICEGVEEAKRYYGNTEEWTHYENLFSIVNRSRESILSTGYVVDTLEAALWCLMTTDSYKECVLTAVNLGDDTDTVAAVAGGLAGALYGLDSIPADWLSILKKREYICELCDRFFVENNYKQDSHTACNLIGKTIKRSGTNYRVFAYDPKQKVSLLEDIDGVFFGSITILTGVEYDGTRISAKQSVTLFTSKQELFNRAKESDSKDVKIIANFIHEKYYKMPTIICEMIAVSYLEEIKEK